MNIKNYIYTSYLGNIKNLNLNDKNTEFIIIMRKLPNKFNLKKYKGLDYNQALSPSEELLNNYLKNNNWFQFEKKFKEEMLIRDDLKINLECLYFKLLKKNICLICCEKDYKHCHRYIIAKYFIEKGFIHKEI